MKRWNEKENWKKRKFYWKVHRFALAIENYLLNIRVCRSWLVSVVSLQRRPILYTFIIYFYSRLYKYLV